MKWIWQFSLLMLTSFIFFFAAFAQSEPFDSKFDAAREQVLMRNIAHQLLRYAGDSVNGVLPLRQLSDREYEITFTDSFRFSTDTIIKIVNNNLQKSAQQNRYIVTVKDCDTKETVYSFAYLGDAQNSILPCDGRVHTEKRYCVNILFDGKKNSASTILWVSGISLLGVVFLIVGMQKRRNKKKSTMNAVVNVWVENGETNGANTDEKRFDLQRIGNFIFSRAEQYLEIENEKIMLTQKETKILSILADQLNQTVDRTRLQKEVWEDEGVIVGRSLDMFISKLRKKLEADPKVKLTNIHSKGYKLELIH